MEGMHRRGAECISEWQYQLSLGLQSPWMVTIIWDLFCIVIFHLCVYSVIHNGFFCICTWYMYEVLTSLHEQMEKKSIIYPTVQMRA